MLRIAMKRGVSAAILIAIASVFSFILIAAFPGNVAALIAELRGGFVSQAVVDQVAIEYGLNDPLPLRYVHWLGDVLQGDFGRSLRTGQPVAEAIVERLEPTLVLIAGGGIVMLIVGVGLSFMGAMWPNGTTDRMIRAFAVLNVSIPKFFLASMLIYAFGVTWNVFPTFGFRGLASWILPSIAIGVVPGALLSRVARVALEETMSKPYAITAISKGFSRRRILFRDALPNIVPVVLTAFGMALAQMVPNAFIIEPIFSWQGLGAYFVEAARFRDLPVLQACLLIFSVLFIVVNLVVDLIVIVVDPLQRRAARA
ncbi:MAG: ABC transporter permease [Mesorhizobium sp.]|nr:ABC transporter permease [Mesorhizobium sp.]RWH82248.1 MAG: ABC transporter permease [Mesorhizobium sp.]RWH85238.1 MAG: ABC transporter permease [Mesorhizobium sp.]RWH89995.1 MAG: ABC transporter permease [Mesorhizobium sp.]RWH98609.1 MAG: ABC transporter permease [Mesorhizobium sp.]RWI04805.1 MAG: ABC transporter permease [Mesorhizobium sp.]